MITIVHGEYTKVIALIFGSILSGYLISALDGAMGYSGWRWLFLLEGIPTVVFGIVVLFKLTDTPNDATWLTEEERDWLNARMKAETEAIVGANEDYSILKALTHPSVLALGVAYFLAVVEGMYGINMWIPQMLKQWSNMSSVEIGFIGSIPYVCAFLAMYFIGWSSKKHQEFKWHLTIPLLISSSALILSMFVSDMYVTLVCLSLGCAGIFCAIPLFWMVPSSFLTGTAAATGIAVINSVGNLGGFFGPTVVGVIRDSTGDFHYGMMFLGVCVFGGMLICHIMNMKYGGKVNYDAVAAEAEEEVEEKAEEKQ